MQEDLNTFTKYTTFSTYSTLFNGDTTPKKAVPKRNPLEYYTKRNIEPPKTMHGDPVKLLEPFQPINQSEQQNQLSATPVQIHLLANEINNLCNYANNIFKPQTQIKKETKAKTTDFDQFKEQLKKTEKNVIEADLASEFQQFLKFKNDKNNQAIKSELTESANTLQIPPVQIKKDPLDTSLERAKSTTKSEITINVPRKTVRELYQRGNKSILTLEELKKSKPNFTKNALPSISQLSQHSDLEIQKAVLLLQGKKVQ